MDVSQISPARLAAAGGGELTAYQAVHGVHGVYRVYGKWVNNLIQGFTGYFGSVIWPLYL
jgi:hypothetical protein